MQVIFPADIVRVLIFSLPRVRIDPRLWLRVVVSEVLLCLASRLVGICRRWLSRRIGAIVRRNRDFTVVAPLVSGARMHVDMFTPCIEGGFSTIL